MKTVILSFDDSRLDFYTNVFPLLKEFNLPATLNVTTDFINHPQNFNFQSGNNEAMTVEQVKACAASGLVEIACHGHKHKNTKNDVAENIEMISRMIGKGMLGFASPTSAITWENKNAEGVWDMVEHGELRYVRSGIRIRREGLIYTLLSVLDSKVHSNYLFCLLNKRSINLKKLSDPLLNSTTIHSYTKKRQIISFVESAPPDSAIILMFHSIKRNGENGYGADKFYFDYDDFRDILCFLKTNPDLKVMKTIDYVNENL